MDRPPASSGPTSEHLILLCSAVAWVLAQWADQLLVYLYAIDSESGYHSLTVACGVNDYQYSLLAGYLGGDGVAAIFAYLLFACVCGTRARRRRRETTTARDLSGFDSISCCLSRCRVSFSVFFLLFLFCLPFRLSVFRILSFVFSFFLSRRFGGVVSRSRRGSRERCLIGAVALAAAASLLLSVSQ